MKLYGTIAKTEEQADGTLIVSGIASNESTDSQGEVVTAEAMKAAIPDYMKFGAVREMHDAKKAAGTAVEISVGDDGHTNFSALVVDPVAVKKVQTGVYKGFSIGGAVTKRNDLKKSQIDGIRLTEISLVDRPANPAAVFTCYKAEGGEGGGEEEIADEIEQVEKTEQAEPVVEQIHKVTIDGAEVAIRKAADGKFEIVTDDVLAKGAYSIGRLACLAEDLEYFASSRQWDAGGEASTIPEATRALAAKLYDLLISLVAEDVATAKQRLKDAKKAEDAEAINKAETGLVESVAQLVTFQKSLGVEELVAFDAEGLGKFASDAAGIESLKKFLGEAGDLAKEVVELRAKPESGGPKLQTVSKADEVAAGGGDAAVNDTPIEAITDPVEQIKKIHAGGGVPLFR